MRKITTFTLATLLTASAFGAGEVYRWRGVDGSWHYSDQPRPGAELVVGVTRTRPPGEATQPAPPPQVEPPATSDDPLPVSQEVAEEVRAAAASAKAEQCKRAEDSYQQALTARRIHKTDADGNRVYLSDAEVDAARLQARASRDLACGSGT
jgi:hypothetical protein